MLPGVLVKSRIYGVWSEASTHGIEYGRCCVPSQSLARKLVAACNARMWSQPAHAGNEGVTHTARGDGQGRLGLCLVGLSDLGMCQRVAADAAVKTWLVVSFAPPPRVLQAVFPPSARVLDFRLLDSDLAAAFKKLVTLVQGRWSARALSSAMLLGDVACDHRRSFFSFRLPSWGSSSPLNSFTTTPGKAPSGLRIHSPR